MPRTPRNRRRIGQVPKEFLCPVSKRFMSDPVLTPTSHRTFDRASIRSLYGPQHLQPNHALRNEISDWLSEFDLRPPFAFISNDSDFVAAVKSLKEYRKISAAESLVLLRQLSSAIQAKPWVLKHEGVACIGRLLGRPSLRADWVITAVGILANADEIVLCKNVRKYFNQHQFDNISSVCPSSNLQFRLGLVNLVHSLVKSGDVHVTVQLVAAVGIVESLVSYGWPTHISFFQGANRHYQKLLDTFYHLSKTEDFCRRIVDAGVVSSLFQLLEIAVSTFGVDNYSRDSAPIETCMHILFRLCQTEVGRLAMVGISDATKLTTFHKALFMHVRRTQPLSAGLGVVYLLLKHCRFTPLLDCTEPGIDAWDKLWSDEYRGTTVATMRDALTSIVLRIQHERNVLRQG